MKGHAVEEDDNDGTYSGEWSVEPRSEEDGGQDVGVGLESNQNTRPVEHFTFDEEKWNGDYHFIFDDAPREPSLNKKLRHKPHLPCEPFQEYKE